eukprot:672133-Alexandrium_andersonii.AAC.1
MLAGPLELPSLELEDGGTTALIASPRPEEDAQVLRVVLNAHVPGNRGGPAQGLHRLFHTARAED